MDFITENLIFSITTAFQIVFEAVFIELDMRSESSTDLTVQHKTKRQLDSKWRFDVVSTIHGIIFNWCINPNE